ncbi:hypothetical protein KNCP2_03300 [Candidatus Rickettsia kedanie]|uniref:Transposase IS200-like domain-containing protein n=2 Tax=Candidatus Rickettsia kedanie TaxID=3115352 RepID=A0ABP9TSC2_9RICK
MEHEVHIILGKVACDHVHMFISYRPQITLSKIVQYLRVVAQEYYCKNLLIWASSFEAIIFGLEVIWQLVRVILLMKSAVY